MKIFLSSTCVDLIEYRQAAIKVLEQLGNQVVRMENFGARPVEPSVACLSEIENCELFVGIYAHRYGYIPDGSPVSITEAEFRHARKHKKPTFCFEVDAEYSWPPEMIESEPGRTKLIALKQEIDSRYSRATFTTPDNLASKIASSVGSYLVQLSSLPLPSTQMQIISPSYFGRLDSERGPFALLLQVKFRNESTQPVLLISFQIQYAGNWYTPQPRIGNVSLSVSKSIYTAALRKGDTVTESLRIPEMDEIKRHAFFIVSDPSEPFPGPERLHIIAEGTFVHQSPQRIEFTLTDRGEIERVEGIGNQEKK